MALVFICGAGARAEEQAAYYDEAEGHVGRDEDPRALSGEREVAAIFAEITEIRKRGNSPDDIIQHRRYRLVPAIRETARLAAELSSTRLLGNALALASCESRPGESYSWMDVLCKAANSFSERDFAEALESLPEANRASLKASMMSNMPESFKWKKLVDGLSGTASDYSVEDLP